MGDKPCYAACLGDCAGDIEREHYFSRSALATLGPGKTLILQGFPWMADGDQHPLSLEKLKKPVLCAKHNRELGSEVDVAGAQFMQALADAEFGVVGVHVVDGELLERWLLKCTIGAVAAGVAQRRDGAILTTSEVPGQWVRYLFGRSTPLIAGYGLWFRYSEKEAPSRGQISFAPVVPPAGDIRASVLTLRGLEFFFCGTRTWPDTARRPADDLLANAAYRPRTLRCVAPTGETRIVLEWPDATGAEIEIRTRLPTNARRPPPRRARKH